MGNPEGNRPPGKPKLTWDNNIQICFKEMRLDGVSWVHLPQGMGQWDDCFERGTGTFGSIECGVVLETLRTYWLLKRTASLG